MENHAPPCRFLDILYSLESCCWFAFEAVVTYSIFYWVASGEKYLNSSAMLGILRLSHTFSMDASVPHCCSLLREGIIKIFFAFSQSYKARLCAGSLTFPFPRIMLWNVHVCALSSNLVVKTASCMCSLSKKSRTCHPQGAGHWSGRGGGGGNDGDDVWVRHAVRWWCPWYSWGNLLVRHPSSLWAGLLMKPVKR